MSGPPAHNTRAATAASASAEPVDQSPWAHDINAAVSALRDEVTTRVGSVERQLADSNNQIAALRSESAIQYQNLVDLIKGGPSPSPPVVPPTTSFPTVFVATQTPLPKVTALPQSPPVATTGSSLPAQPSMGPAPWSQGPLFKSQLVDDSSQQSSPPGLGITLVDDPSISSSLRVDPSGTVSLSPAAVPKGYTIKTSDIGTFDGTPEDLELFLARVEALNDSESDLNWKQAVLRAMPLLLRGYAASWHQTLDKKKRASLTSLTNWFRELRFAFSPDPTYMRQLARARTWQPDHEDVVGYVFDKTALLKAAFVGVPDSKIIFDVVERLPVGIRKLLRTPLERDASLVDLRNELRMQEQFWRVETGRPLQKSTTSGDDPSSKPPRYASFAGPSPATIAAPPRSTASHSTTTVKTTPLASFNASRRPEGKSLFEDFDASRLDYGIESESGKRMMRYRVPGTDKVMWFQRSCRRCGADHFDFAHEHCTNRSTASVNTAAMEDDLGYLVTSEEENVNGSEPPPLSTQPLLRPERVDDGESVESKTLCSPPDAPIIGQGCKSSVERAAPPTGPGTGLHAGYSSKLNALAAGEGSGPPLDRARQGPSFRGVSSAPNASSVDKSVDTSSFPLAETPSESPHLFFADRPQFLTSRVLSVDPSDRPLSHETRRNGDTVVALSVTPDTRTGQAYRQHVPLTLQIRVNDTKGKPLSSLLDTGASLSSIDATLLRDLGGTPTGSSIRVSGLGATETLGWATVTFFVAAKDSHCREVVLECTQDFHVLPHFAPGLCLGLDFISPQAVTIDAKQERASIGRYTFPVTEKLSAPFAKETELCSTSACFLPARTSTWVPVDAASLAPALDYTIFPRLMLSADEEVQVAGPTAVGTRGLSHVLVTNLGNRSFTLPRRTPVADATIAHLGDATASLGHTFTLGSPSPPGATLAAMSAADVWVAEEEETPEIGEAALPPDLFEGVVEPAHDLARDAATTIVDDHFKVGIDHDGNSPPEIVDLLRRHTAAFALDGRPGLIQDAEMTIPLNDEASLRPEPPRRASPEKRAAMDSAIEQLLAWDVIEPSTSPVSFPVLMIRQYNKWRFCVDYRQLNAVTVADRYPLPTTDAVFQTLMGKKWFSSLDAIRGYHQMKKHCYQGQSAEASGLKFSPAKCTFGVPSLVLLGRKVSGAGVAIWDERAKAVRDLPQPRTLRDLYHTIGLFGYYRIFIQRFAEIAEPLTRLTKGWRYAKVDGRTRLVDTAGDPASADRTVLDWGPEQEESFRRLKDIIAHPPVLAHPDPSRPYVLYVDASKKAFAAILHQVFADSTEVAPPTLAAAAVNAQHFITLPAPVARERWEAWLRADPAFRLIYHRAARDDDTEWVLRDGILSRRVDGRIALPEAAVPTVMREVHDSRGNFGFTKTYLAIARHFWRPRLIKIVRAWIRHCASCLTTKIRPKVGELDISADAQNPFEAIAVDLVLGFPRTRAGNDAVLAIQDLFSRMMLLEPCSSTVDAAAIASILSNRVLRLGWRPRRLISDSEAKMTGSVMQSLADSLGAELTPSPPYHQQANTVERFVQTMQNVVRTMAQGDHTHWDRRVIPAVEIAMNSMPNVVTQERPFDLVFIAHPDVVHAVFDVRDGEPGSFADQLAAANARMDEARSVIFRERNRQKRRYDGDHAPLPTLKEGDEVYVRLKDRPLPGVTLDKLTPRKAGPFRVAEVVSPHRVRLALPADLSVDSEFSVDHLDVAPAEDDPYSQDRVASSSAPVAMTPSPPASPPLPPRVRTMPTALRDFQLGVQAHLDPELLRGPLYRPRYVEVDGGTVMLRERPVAFLSRLTTITEKGMIAAELELCCLAWAYAKWSHLLEGAEITVVTDHSPLGPMLTAAAGQTYGPTISRCRALLLPHVPNFRFVHRAGRTHTNVDSLSRLVAPSLEDPGRSSS
ncbi:hypothetical protein CF327_g3061 [Tilletia walkeri]|nr:hypothetical protein CF327_g3061 [Tilletia walkeri]